MNMAIKEHYWKCSMFRFSTCCWK